MGQRDIAELSGRGLETPGYVRGSFISRALTFGSSSGTRHGRVDLKSHSSRYLHTRPPQPVRSASTPSGMRLSMGRLWRPVLGSK